MPIVRRTRAEIDDAKLLAELAARPKPSEEEIEAQAGGGSRCVDRRGVGGGRASESASLAEGGSRSSRQIGLTQTQFAGRFGFTLDTVQQYEQGRRRPSGPASTLLRVIEADPEAVVRALRFRKAG